MTLDVRTDRSLIRADASSTRYVLVRMTAPAARERKVRLPVNIAIVLDRSGSMEGERKFALARQAVEQSLKVLRADDRFSLVVFDTEIDVLAHSQRATPEAKRKALAALESVEPRSGTDLGAGWLKGCEQVAEYLDGDSVNRCLLLTDGMANHGITDRSALAEHAGELRRRGVVTSTFGVGDDFDERLLRDMAHEGGGNMYFIEGASQIVEMLTGELGEALEVTMRGAALEVTLPPGADAEVLNRYRSTHVRGDNELRVDLGDLVSLQEMAAVLRLTFPRGEQGSRSSVHVALTVRDELVPREQADVAWQYASHAENDAQERDREVDREVAALYAARARSEATEANRDGDYQRARRVLERTASRIRQYAADDVRLGELARDLVAEVEQFAERAMDAKSLKRVMYGAEAALMSRDVGGKARRGPQ